jgi:TolA-binding protein
MNRRHALTLLVGVAAGCSSQSSEPTATPEPTPTTETDAETAAPTSTSTPEPTAASVDADAIAASLNEVYAELEPALATLEVTGLDLDALGSRLGEIREDVDSAREAGVEDESRLQSLSDTRWVFDRIVRTFVRFDEAYTVHEQVREAYAASDVTEEARTALERLKTLATEAASSAGTATSRYDSMTGFDPALDVSYEGFEEPVFRVSDTANALTPFARGLERAIPARERYQQAVASYEDESYRDAQSAFADLVRTFTDARDRFEGAEGMAGPLAPALEQYRCEVSAARLACVEYRAACREQLDGNPDRAERRRTQAEKRYGECG